MVELTAGSGVYVRDTDVSHIRQVRTKVRRAGQDTGTPAYKHGQTMARHLMNLFWPIEELRTRSFCVGKNGNKDGTTGNSNC